MVLLNGSDSGYRPGYELAAEQILGLIVEREMRPGERLPTERELADLLGLSRSVTREAVKVLTALGRVSAQRGRGLFVGTGTPDAVPSMLAGHRFLPGRIEQVEQLLEFRMLLEVHSAAEAARHATPPQISELRQALADCDSALQSGEHTAWEEADTRFHLGLALASGNGFLHAALESVRQLQEQVVQLAMHGGSGGSLEVAQHEHEEVLEAVRSGEPEKAAESVRRHLLHTIDGYRAEIARVIAAHGPQSKRS